MDNEQRKKPRRDSDACGQDAKVFYKNKETKGESGIDDKEKKACESEITCVGYDD